ncbi:MAG: HNH endonuclease [Candidatus Promineofilum sp.]|nr:HNH endonuclease [Promineifilum sp.]
MTVSASLRRLVFERDGYGCVYCLTTQENSGQPLQIDHIEPTAKGGATTLDNLCSCCASCNYHKSAKQDAPDPLTTSLTPLFHPLQQDWQEHFVWDESSTVIVGLTPCGRATIVALQMNNDLIVRARRRWVEGGWHPPA